MIESSDIKKYAEHIFSRSRGHADKHIMHPQREWILILGGFLVLFLIGVIHGVYQFRYYQTYSESVTPQANLVLPQYQGQAVARAHDFYQTKQEQFDEYLQQTSVVVTEASTSTGPINEEVEPIEVDTEIDVGGVEELFDIESVEPDESVTESEEEV